MMKLGEYEIPPNWESMSCIHNCGFVLVWERGKSYSAGLQMDEHVRVTHLESSSLFHWLKFWRREY
jgi:hypothetical protein